VSSDGRSSDVSSAAILPRTATGTAASGARRVRRNASRSPPRLSTNAFALSAGSIGGSEVNRRDCSA